MYPAKIRIYPRFFQKNTTGFHRSTDFPYFRFTNHNYPMYRLIQAFILLALPFISHCMNLRQINTADGLTNSAILSLHCGSDGMLWIGTCDGLNISDGYSVYPTRVIPEYASLTGNIIENIVESSPGTLWVQTNYGLNKITSRNNSIVLFPEFQGQEKIVVAPDYSIFVLNESCDLLYCGEDDSQFSKLVNLQFDFHSIYDIRITDAQIRIFTDRGIFEYNLQNGSNGYVVGKPHQISDQRLIVARCDGDNTHAVDPSGNVLEFRGLNPVPTIIYNISDDLHRRGDVSDMILDDNGNIFIAFRTGGVIKLAQGNADGYSREDLGVDIGVFCLAKSPLQNVIWAGTDCHGVYTFYDNPYTIQFLGFKDFGNKISHPVRAIYYDSYSNLWLGTKGDGLLCVRDFSESNGRGIGSEVLYTMDNSPLSDNSVYAISKSDRPLIWIAGDRGIDYYSYTDKSIHSLDTDGHSITPVHGLYEANDSTLFISTTGNGIFKARIAGSRDFPVLRDIKQYTIDNGNFSSNYFFAQLIDDIDNPIFCNRGLGIFTLKDEKLTNIHKLGNDNSDKTINDVFAVIRDSRAIWVGTGSGLVKIASDGDRLFAGVEYGFLNNTIHSMLKDDYDNLWISTNKGIVRFNTTSEDAHNYLTSYNISGNEFSDGAAFKSDSTLMFGGVDGIVIVSRSVPTPPGENYMPPLSVVGLSIGGQNVPLNSYLTGQSAEPDRCDIRLEADQNYFSITLSAPDFTNPDNYIFFYSLDDNKWISNGPNRQLTFTKLDFGKNTLKVKYRNLETGAESGEYVMNIEIKAPWYLSALAKLIYILVIAMIVLVIVRFYYMRQNEKQKNEVYESKLKFFSNISHELFTPLTLIYGTGERMLADDDTDPETRKHINLIMSNTERLNSLIQDLVDFRKIESGNKKVKIVNVDASAAANEIYNSFSVIAEQNGIDFVKDIPAHLKFNTDYESLVRIISNLVSNAFKYTPADGTVKLHVYEDDNNLKIEIYNTGKGISEIDRKKIFNRYTILDNVEKNATKGLSSRNGLGLAICHSLVEMLDGRIDIESEVGSYALFRVSLPQKPLTSVTDEDDADEKTVLIESENEIDGEGIPSIVLPSHGKANILVIDDNPGILDLLSETLTEYNIIQAMSAADGLKMLKSFNIDLIITDVMMPDNDGVSLTRNIKGNKHTMHIPIIILSAKHSNSEKVKGLAAGADVYVGKPFQLSYLRAVIYRLLEKQQTMKEFYNTSASAYGYANGRLQDKESTDFIDKITTYIDANIENEKLNAETIAEHMQMGVRNLYRKFKDIELPPPNEFIKAHKLSIAAKLLVTTSFTVQEVIYRSGFNNRSHFYREFQRQFGMPPKDYRTKNKIKSDFTSN